MRPTPSGWRLLVLTAVTLAAALASGNNLLYLLYGLMLGLFAVSAAWLQLAHRRLRATLRSPEGALAGGAAILRLQLRNEGRWAVCGLRARLGEAEAVFADLAPGTEADAPLAARLPWRGRNLLGGLRLETAHPFGLLRRSLAVEDAVALALPGGGRGSARGDAAAAWESEGGAASRRGGAEDLRSVRPYEASDGPRFINWKLTARMGRPYVNEYSQAGGSKVSIRAEDESEEAIDRAAWACRRAIDAGCEVRLSTREGSVEYGRGPSHLRALLEALALLGQGKIPRPVVLEDAARATEAAPSPAETALAHGCFLSVGLSLFLIEEANPALLAGLVAAILGGIGLDLRSGPRLPRRAWTAASLAMLVYSVLIGWRVHGVTLANTYLLVYLLAHQALTEKTAPSMNASRAIVFLAFFLTSGQTISLWYFAHFLAFSLLFAAWLWSGRGAIHPRRLAAFWAAAVSVCAAGFIATPRIDPLKRMNPFVAMGLDQRAPKAEFVSGFTENVSLGFFGRIKKSSARVMRVRPPGWTSPLPPYAYLRLRGSAFDHFDGRNWRKGTLDFLYRVGPKSYRTREGKAWLPRRGDRFFLPGADRGIGPILEFSVLPLNSAVLFTHRGARAMESPESAVYFDFTDTVYAASPYIGGATYLSASSPGEGRIALAEGAPGYERILQQRFLQLPAGLDERVGALAEKLTLGAASSEEKARKVELYLRKAYSYSLYAEAPNSSLPDFLFKSRSGNCEHFATAAAILLRAAGVPTRLVTGFLADDWNEFGRFYDVRQGQAHAWAEAFAPGIGWITVEATPPGGESRVRSRLRRWFTAAQTSWFRNVIGYDRFLQRNTFHRFRLAARLSRLAPALAAGLRRAGPPLAAGAAAALLLFALRRRLRRAGRPSTPFERARALLERGGVAMDPRQTPREFAAGLARERPELGAILELARLHEAARWRPGGLRSHEAARAERAFEDLRAALAPPRRRSPVLQ